MADTFNQIVVVLAVVVWLFLLYRAARQWRVMRKWVEPADLRRRLDDGEDVLVLDVRTPEEFSKNGHIAEAVNVPLKELPGRLTQIKGQLTNFADASVVVVCQVGGRSTSAIFQLQRAGLKQARIMRGGMNRWQYHNLPVQKG